MHMSVNKRPDLTPHELLEQEAMVARALAEADPSLRDGLPEERPAVRLVSDPEFPASPPTVIAEPDTGPAGLSAILKRSRPKKKVVLRNDLIGSISFSVTDVSINSRSVGFLIDDSIGFEPADKAIFDLEFEKEKMRVIYVGGLFQFKEERLALLSFLRYIPPHDQNSSS